MHALNYTAIIFLLRPWIRYLHPYHSADLRAVNLLLAFPSACCPAFCSLRRLRAINGRRSRCVHCHRHDKLHVHINLHAAPPPFLRCTPPAPLSVTLGLGSAPQENKRQLRRHGDREDDGVPDTGVWDVELLHRPLHHAVLRLRHASTADEALEPPWRRLRRCSRGEGRGLRGTACLVQDTLFSTQASPDQGDKERSGEAVQFR